MSTSEDDMSTIHADGQEPLPTYVEHEEGYGGLQALLSALSASPDGKPLDPKVLNEVIESQKRAAAESVEAGAPGPVDNFPSVPFAREPDELTRAQRTIIKGFFDAISKEEEEVIALFINNSLVTANTTMEGRTPLLAAVATRNVRIVKQLVDFGAEPDAFGVESKKWHWDLGYGAVVKRTPLQLAASIGHLTLVKLFMEAYHCDDSRIAPDGQIALRLAAENGHREVVAYLPARRGGGFLRWQTHHQKAIRRTKKALRSVYHFLKFFFWDIEKFFVWTVPKALIVKPLAKGCAWCWRNRKGFWPWCKYQIQQTPVRIQRFGKWVWKGVKTVPKAAADAGKAIWKFSTKTLPRWLKELVLWLWSLFTKRLPNAIAIIAKWIWAGLSSIGKSVLNVILRTVSLLHSIFEAIISFFRSLTLTDIWNGFCDLLRAIFITFPKKIWSWILALGEVSYKVMKAVFGGLGDFIWWVGYGIVFLAIYVPRELWVVLQSLGSSLANALHEFMVWVNPKA